MQWIIKKSNKCNGLYIIDFNLRIGCNGQMAKDRMKEYMWMMKEISWVNGIY